RSAAGKSRMRFNALKHGLRAKTPVLPGEDPDAFRGRLDAWTADLKPRDDVDRFLLTRAVHASWMLDRAARAAAARADADSLADQAEQVAVLGSRLFRELVRPRGLAPLAPADDGDVVRRPDPDDPDDPARIVIRLEATALGCAWLLDRWAELRQILEHGLLW